MRPSKTTRYHHSVIRYWGNNPDEHNLRRQRRNFQALMEVPKVPPKVQIINAHINHKQSLKIAWGCENTDTFMHRLEGE